MRGLPCNSRDEKRLISAFTALETGIVAEAKKGEAGGRELNLLVHQARIEIAPLTTYRLKRESTMINVRKLKASYIIDKQGKRTSVILPMKEFEELLEDIEDLATIAERREEPTISHEDLIAELRKNGFQRVTP